ncbi:MULTISPECIES: sugar phosphate isomerase/epimerase family protein [unclassified Actinomyces]|uniref:sugar phosphate isomerase/epimerase family protein n=1 Tax=unclassified Actinomyces TaxID=2609248 RepID=UPI002017A625|nr:MULTISPECIES: sugar phosphate isomerase/epimerase family protein [unclassified Actinomyces]MCL3777714.1 sugar phosphate isomerase/epimerase [Actinomyces sp. AC-20-1]MCL3789842.1 sugar phosphate isomerase/epimerase [Actinomyces sp. 187325]MCL3791514.1 sugar phosphate isomerase/epimerase [Actinomyces sp. 186855]MCL3793833.1 sugar phosphate isomerase/epimerase [Actinomyces sp. 217892]
MAVPVGLSTSSVYPGNATAAFRTAAELGYDGVEVMVWSERVTQDATALGRLAEHYGQPVLAVHAPTLILTRPVFGPDPWEKIDRSVALAEALGAPTVVLHPPFFWQTRYARQFVRGIDMREQTGTVHLAVENMFTWRPRQPHSTRDFQGYSPTWDPVGQGYRSVTLDISHAATSGSDALAMARALGPTLRHLHLTDGVPGFHDDHLLPGQGDQDCAGVLRHLAATGFETGGGQVVVEVSTRGMSEEQRLEALASSLAFAREHLEGAGDTGAVRVPAPTRRRYRHG